MANKREVIWIFDGQNAHTKTPPEISEHDLLRANNIHFSTYSNNKDSMFVPQVTIYGLPQFCEKEEFDTYKHSTK
jgi:hypothetical protein